MDQQSGFVQRAFEADGLGQFLGWVPVGTPPELGMIHAQGWHAPLFQRKQVFQILAGFRGPGVSWADYDSVTDTVIILEHGCDPIVYPGLKIMVDGETRTVYGLGNGDWDWHLVGNEAHV